MLVLKCCVVFQLLICSPQKAGSCRKKMRILTTNIHVWTMEYRTVQMLIILPNHSPWLMKLNLLYKCKCKCVCVYYITYTNHKTP